MMVGRSCEDCPEGRPFAITRALVTYNQMVVEAERADVIFAALGDRTRRDILSLVLAGEHSVSELARRFPMSFAAVQKHVAVLERAGLVSKRRKGREQRVSGNPAALYEAHRLLYEMEGVWRDRIDRIGDIVAELEEGARQ
jgi:DNA-binding transcriptional ArsR family regulator